MLGVIDYRTGNAQSVMYALRHLDVPARLVASPADCAGVDRFVLPGVGAADVTMTSLADAGWVDVLAERVRDGGTPFLGICVGLQVLFDHSDEHDVKCLGWLPGRVRRFDRAAVRVPHMGWNVVQARSAHPFVAELAPGPGSQFYFVNSYYAVPEDAGHVAAVTEYGVEFASVVAYRNIMATQFHTEKSGPLGLRLLARFAALGKDELC